MNRHASTEIRVDEELGFGAGAARASKQASKQGIG